MQVSIIGSGNVAWHLAPALDNTGFVVREVYSRDRRRAQALVGRLYQAEAKDTLDFSGSDSEIFIIAVADDAIPEVVQALRLPPQAILVHTSGSQPLDLLLSASKHAGVFYPLQTFSREKKISFEEVPLFVESTDRETAAVLMKMGKTISRNVNQITSSQRLALHVAAVFASNFANHMLTLSSKVMKDNKLQFEWLKPLIVETINKALAIGPESAQTGPARRGDLEILDKHFDFLESDPDMAEIYRVISQHIVDTFDE